jgi:glycosyltransferase involved in cell wall biosynthesis
MFDKKISLVIAARNDSYMGNFKWRLETTINYIAAQLQSIDWLQQVEIIIVDWGSASPLREVVQTSKAAEQIIRYIEVPIDVHEKVCLGSDFPLTIALNVGIRRAKGELIALTSGDVLWKSEVFQSLFSLQKSVFEHSLFFIPRKNIPWDIVSQSPGIAEMTKYIDTEGTALEVEPLLPFYMGCAGALAMHRDRWFECHGNDERLVFWGYNDIDLNLRMRLKYACLDYYQTNKVSVFHLEHYPSRNDKQSAPKKLNPHVFNPLVVNDENWGLARYSFAEWPRQEESSTMIAPAEKKNRNAVYFRAQHLLHILSFMFSGYTKKHFSWSFSILRDYFIDLLPFRNN